MSDDPRRARPIAIRWDGLIGKLFIDKESWGAIEWSEKRQAWCIEDAEGRCLSHHSHVHGADKDKAGAIALAEAMIRDGRMPSPEVALRLRNGRLERDRERRAKQPAEIRRRERRADDNRLLKRLMEAERADEREAPLYEVIADVFDLSDPQLWRSNSFARLRGRLIVAVRAAIADMEWSGTRSRFRLHDDEKKLARAREILALLLPEVQR